MATATESRAQVDLTDAIRPGDGVLWSQGTGEPRTLTEAFVRGLPSYPQIELFLGGTFSDTLAGADLGAVRLTVLGGAGANARLAPAGGLAVLPCHVSTVPRLIERGAIRADVVLIQVAPPGADGAYNLGVIADYVHEAIARARLVVAEVNARMPRTAGDTRVAADAIDRVVESDRPLVAIAPPPAGPVERAIAAHVADLVPNGATVQVGIGAVPNAILAGLRGHRDLGLHSGAVGDELVELIACGAMTGARKRIDAGVAVAGALFGTERLYDFAHENPAIAVRTLRHTHDPATIAALGPFVAINGALEVDLTGQVNAETLGGRHVGAVGGQVDFVRAAMVAPEGRSIIALPATGGGGAASRIVARLGDGVVTTARSDADVVVTEHGVAHLRGCSLPERARRLTAIADPAFRDELTAAARRLC